MNAPEMLFALILLRLVIPFGSVLLLGEWLSDRERVRLPRA